MQQLGPGYRFVIIDAEAGMEHISRGTIGHPDLLLIVSDPGARGLRTVLRIQSIATCLGLEPDRIHSVLNRFKPGAAPVEMRDDCPISIIPYDPAVEDADLAGTPVSLIPQDSPAWMAVVELAGKIQELSHTARS
jgi:CO dehydrogenase maturation factor